MPRDLITVLLFYSIPETLAPPQFIMTTTLLMASDLLLFKDKTLEDTRWQDDT